MSDTENSERTALKGWAALVDAWRGRHRRDGANGRDPRTMRLLQRASSGFLLYPTFFHEKAHEVCRASAIGSRRVMRSGPTRDDSHRARGRRVCRMDRDRARPSPHDRERTWHGVVRGRVAALGIGGLIREASQICGWQYRRCPATEIVQRWSVRNRTSMLP